MSTHVAGMKAILIAARELIEKPEAWCKFELARMGSVPVWSGSEDATCFCALGAIVRLLGSATYGSPVEDALDSAVPGGFACASDFNDAPTTTHADVLALYDRAIEAAQ